MKTFRIQYCPFTLNLLVMGRTQPLRSYYIYCRLATSRPHEFQGRICWAAKRGLGREATERSTKSGERSFVRRVLHKQDEGLFRKSTQSVNREGGRGENRNTRRKTSRSRVENQSQTQPTYHRGPVSPKSR